jgi:predicted phosphodiesterase
MISVEDVQRGPLPVDVIAGVLRRVAVLSDVHGNLPAFQACLADVEREGVDAVFFLGDLTWGPQPAEALALAASIVVPHWFVRGNSERAVVEFASGKRKPMGVNESWIVEAHGPGGVKEVTPFSQSLEITTTGIGRIRLCHGSPRSDIELLTPQTPADRIAIATAGVAAHTIAHGHTHLQYQRTVNDRSIFGPGSVGIPYGTNGRPGARWALLTDHIDLRVSPYDIEEAIESAKLAGYPGIVNYEKYLRTPPSTAEIVEEAESRQFAD